MDAAIRCLLVMTHHLAAEAAWPGFTAHTHVDVLAVVHAALVRGSL